MIKEIISFLSALKQNNNRDWFYQNKSWYDKVKSQFEEIVLKLIQEISLFDNEIGYPDPKKCVFRINRDIRFSRDKSPYKTNFGGFIVKEGKNSGNAGYYLHLEPGDCFIAGGAYMPESNNLKNIRLDICHHINEFINIIKNPDFVECFGEIEGDKLKKIPKGFPEDFPYPELIKYKSYTVFTKISPQQLEMNQSEFIKLVSDIFSLMRPFIKFLNRAINIG